MVRNMTGIATPFQVYRKRYLGIEKSKKHWPGKSFGNSVTLSRMKVAHARAQMIEFPLAEARYSSSSMAFGRLPLYHDVIADSGYWGAIVLSMRRLFTGFAAFAMIGLGNTAYAQIGIISPMEANALIGKP